MNFDEIFMNTWETVTSNFFFRQICQGNNSDNRVNDTHHFLFPTALSGHDTYSWSSISGQVSSVCQLLVWKVLFNIIILFKKVLFRLKPIFEISVQAFEYDSVGGDDDLGVTSYTYRGNTPIVQTVTTTPGNKNLRLNMT